MDTDPRGVVTDMKTAAAFMEDTSLHMQVSEAVEEDNSLVRNFQRLTGSGYSCLGCVVNFCEFVRTVIVISIKITFFAPIIKVKRKKCKVHRTECVWLLEFPVVKEN